MALTAISSSSQRKLIRRSVAISVPDMPWYAKMLRLSPVPFREDRTDRIIPIKGFFITVLL